MPWITVGEAREQLGNAVGLSTLYLLLRKGQLVGTKIGGKILVDTDSLADLIEKGRVALISVRKRQRNESG